MQEAQFYWKLFLETGAPEAYLSYKNAIANNQTLEKAEPEERQRVF